jgi:spermidine synthase
VEHDPLLLDLVVRTLPLELVIGDARAELERSEPARWDVVVADVFTGAWMPDSVATSGFARAARRALRPGGLLAMNLTDVPPQARTRVQVATVRSVFADVCLLAADGVLKGRTAGNAVLAASDSLGDLPVRTGAVHGPTLDAFSTGARARLDEPG